MQHTLIHTPARLNTYHIADRLHQQTMENTDNSLLTPSCNICANLFARTTKATRDYYIQTQTHVLYNGVSLCCPAATKMTSPVYSTRAESIMSEMSELELDDTTGSGNGEDPFADPPEDPFADPELEGEEEEFYDEDEDEQDGAQPTSLLPSSSATVTKDPPRSGCTPFQNSWKTLKGLFSGGGGGPEKNNLTGKGKQKQRLNMEEVLLEEEQRPKTKSNKKKIDKYGNEERNVQNNPLLLQQQQDRRMMKVWQNGYVEFPHLECYT